MPSTREKFLSEIDARIAEARKKNIAGGWEPNSSNPRLRESEVSQTRCAVIDAAAGQPETTPQHLTGYATPRYAIVRRLIAASDNVWKAAPSGETVGKLLHIGCAAWFFVILLSSGVSAIHSRTRWRNEPAPQPFAHHSSEPKFTPKEDQLKDASPSIEQSRVDAAWQEIKISTATQIAECDALLEEELDQARIQGQLKMFSKKTAQIFETDDKCRIEAKKLGKR